MTELDEEFLPLAAELIDQYGADVQFGAITPGAYDADTGDATPAGALASHKAIIAAGSTRTRGGGLVEGAELALIIAGVRLATEPTPEDKATVNGTNYSALRAEPTYSGQEIAIWTIWLGK